MTVTRETRPLQLTAFRDRGTALRGWLYKAHTG